MTEDQANAIAARLVHFLETGEVPDGLFTADVFCDFTLPCWRLQARGIADTVALRKRGHPGPGRVPRWRCDPTPAGFVVELEESWEQDGDEWYAREMVRCDVAGTAISAIAIYCTGDWSSQRRAEHARQVQLLRY